MKHKGRLKFVSTVFAGLFLAAGNLTAQERSYQQINLAGSDPGAANHVTSGLINPWAIAFLPAQPFVIDNTNSGRVIAHDANGSSIGLLPAFNVGSVDGLRPGSPTGMVADPNSFFGGRGQVQPFILATEDGGIFSWGPDPVGDRPPNATLVVNNSSTGAVYTGIAILTPDCCAPFLVAANFQAGAAETFTSSFELLGAAGNFKDPDLPAGYAPYGMQVIGRQLFITFALQDTARHNPVAGAGNGIVDVFDLEGNFVKRFATGGPLNAPWGVTKASANFGPFSNDILIGNFGDGIINAFDPVTGNLAGQIHDESGRPIVNPGLHALVFRNDGFGDPNTLYFTAGINDGNGGLFGAIKSGLPSTLLVTAPDSPTDVPVTFTVTVFTGPPANGNPTGNVDFLDGGALLGTSPVVDGEARLTITLTALGLHTIEARYSGDTTFLASNAQTEMHVTGPATNTILTVVATAQSNTPVTLTATTSAASGTPTGSIQFRDQSSVLGTSPLSAAGVATLTISTLSPGIHTVVAVYAGDGNFSGSISAVESLTIISGDFQLGTAPPSATLSAGQSARFAVTVTPSGGFADNVSFSCQAPAGFTCGFDPPSVSTGAGPASTVLTVVASASAMGTNGVGLVFAGLMLMGAGFLRYKSRAHCAGGSKLAWAARIMVSTPLVVALAGCGGYGNQAPPATHTSSIMVTARSGALTHNLAVNITVR